LGCIKRLELQNFQSHKKSTIIFHDKLTVILGQTDQGKSAIIRALKWVLYNEPRGTDFITAGCKTCRVSLEMSDGTIITREREGNRNRYILTKDGQKQIFEGFGHNVPLEITKAHGIPKIFIDRDSNAAVNLAEQLEPPFLISESGSNRAKALGRLVGVHIIDAAQRTALKDLTDAEQRRKLLNSDIEAIKQELGKYDDLKEREETILKLKYMLKQLKQKKTILLRLCEIKQKLMPTFDGIRESAGVIEKTRQLIKAEENISKIDVMDTKHRKLIDIVKRMKLIENDTKKETNCLTKTSGIPQSEANFLLISDLYEKLKRANHVKCNLNHTQKGIRDVKAFINSTNTVFLADKATSELIKLSETVSRYVQLEDKLKSVECSMNVQKNELLNLKNIVDAQSILDTTIAKASKLSVLDSIKKSIYSNEQSGAKGKAYLRQVSDSINFMTEEYCILLKKLSRCPTCLSPVDDKTAERIASDILDDSKSNGESERYGC
jgi:exonuclease SbcC